MPIPPSYLTIESLGGGVPVQGEGKLKDGRRFYFRARHERWSFSVGATSDEAIENPTWIWAEPWGDAAYSAGYMPEPLARAIIQSCGEMIAKGVPEPVERKGIDDCEREAFRFANVLVQDIVLYQGDAYRDAGRSVLHEPIAEARAFFAKRFAPKYHPIFEAAVLTIDARLRGEAIHETWILDDASATSVGRRWVSMVALLPPAERERSRRAGSIWLSRWTKEGTPLEKMRAEVRAAGIELR
jgi:hypothetical protein